MATLHSPVELPTGRHSLVEFPMTANIQDPTSWDVLADDGRGTRHDSKQHVPTDFAGRPPARTSSRPSSRGQPSIRTRASPAMEFPPQELEAQSLSYFPPRQSSAHTMSSEPSGKRSPQQTRSHTGHLTQTSADYTESVTSASTAGTNSLLENQVYSILGTITPKEEQVESPILQSARSPAVSIKKLPTSKYKKKPPPSLRSSIKRKSEGVVDTPLGSPMSSYTHILQSPTGIEGSQPMPAELPTVITPTTLPSSLPTPPPEAQLRQGQAPLQHAKSTASVRKARALHSHPSIPSIRSEEVIPSPQITTQPSPSLPAMRNRKSVDAARNRPSLYELQEPTPAPTGPLPDLPAGVPPLSRPASRDVIQQPVPPPDAHMRPGTSSSTIAPTLRRQDTSPPIHAEMANFMASSSKIIFRRFHDVHIRLLLTLQDEISGLEKELAEIESVDNPIDVEREARRVKVLSDLRKLLAEYDHLFSNWNLMQASKADRKTREELEQFLKRPGLNPGSTISTGAVDDLVWIQNHSNDLSCVDLSVKQQEKAAAVTTKNHNTPVEKKEVVSLPLPESSAPRSAATGGGSGGGGGGGGGGFAALFASCAGKRK